MSYIVVIFEREGLAEPHFLWPLSQIHFLKTVYPADSKFSICLIDGPLHALTLRKRISGWEFQGRISIVVAWIRKYDKSSYLFFYESTWECIFTYKPISRMVSGQFNGNFQTTYVRFTASYSLIPKSLQLEIRDMLRVRKSVWNLILEWRLQFE